MNGKALQMKREEEGVKIQTSAVHKTENLTHPNSVHTQINTLTSHTFAELIKGDPQGPSVCDLNVMVCGVSSSSHQSKKERQRQQEKHEKAQNAAG